MTKQDFGFGHCANCSRPFRSQADFCPHILVSEAKVSTSPLSKEAIYEKNGQLYKVHADGTEVKLVEERINPENTCAHLFSQEVDLNKMTIEEMFAMQRSLQANLAARGKALDYNSASFKDRVDDISRQWRNMNLEMAELIERLPFKEWKTYSEEQKTGFASEEQRLEVLYEYIDVFHFFMNVGLDLGIDGETFKRLYATKNKENFDRQARGY